MRIDKVQIKAYKNLTDFEIDIDEEKMITVLLGQNATGKSNFIEALVLIFKHLDLNTDSKRSYPNFEYSIKYQIKNKMIEVVFENKKYAITVDGQSLSLKEFFAVENKKQYQPKYVFTYYSGISNKLKEHFWDHQNTFYDKIIKESFDKSEIDELRKLFYVQLVHSYFVLLGFYTHKTDSTNNFLKDVLGIEDINSVLFILKKPEWAKDTEDVFWGAKGLVREFLNILWDLSFAPIYNSERIRKDFREYDSQDRLYLYLKGEQEIQSLANHYNTNVELFKALESTYISKLLEEVRIRVQKRNVDQSITFRDLSEGEQQLLTVLGLLKFTKDEDSLILLDEPDTHLNPLWKWHYMKYLEEVVQKPESTQIFINTHDPLVIGSLVKEEVRIFTKTENGTITNKPEVDPKGLGVDNILKSELFGLPSTLDEPTLQKIEKRNRLAIKNANNEASEEELFELNQLHNELQTLGFTNPFNDPMYQKFAMAYQKYEQEEHSTIYSSEQLKKQEEIALSIINRLKSEEK
ncbi:AAA family ATPase [Empedobacter sp.]|uniref:AAA family ATPase n=1 Tax=Empedobacter sp. TaxID=1927715 RepID=UPI0028ACDC49|nr:AAA family ATPase [Empedobacter sp.]